MISRKIWMTEKSRNFHTVQCVNLRQINNENIYQLEYWHRQFSFCHLVVCHHNTISAWKVQGLWYSLELVIFSWQLKQYQLYWQWERHHLPSRRLWPGLCDHARQLKVRVPRTRLGSLGQTLELCSVDMIDNILVWRNGSLIHHSTQPAKIMEMLQHNVEKAEKTRQIEKSWFHGSSVKMKLVQFADRL